MKGAETVDPDEPGEQDVIETNKESLEETEEVKLNCNQYPRTKVSNTENIMLVLWGMLTFTKLLTSITFVVTYVGIE